MNISVFLLGAALATGQVSDAEPIKTIDAYVTPYYSAAESEGTQPSVSVAQAYDTLLAQGGEENLSKVVDAVKADGGLITPMTLMVLAIRLYDAGLRDDSVFWFYVAKDRYLTASRVLDFSNPALSEARSAIGAFATLAGPYINGYAFCDIAKQQAALAKAVEWVASHPYQAVFLPGLPAKPGDRQENLDLAIKEMRARAQEEADGLRDPQFLKTLAQGRAENQADAQFCRQ